MKSTIFLPILFLAITKASFSQITIIDEQYRCQGGIIGERREWLPGYDPVIVPVSESYDLWEKEGRTGTGSCTLYACNQADRFFVEADTGAVSNYGSAMADAATEGNWTFQPNIEGLRVAFDYISYDSYYPAIPYAVLTDLTTSSIVFSLDWKREFHLESDPFSLDISHTYLLSMKVDAGTSDAFSGGKLSMNIIPEPATLSLFVFGIITMLEKRK